MKVKDSRLKKTSTDNKSSQLVPLWPVTVRRVRKPQTLKRRPVVRNKDGDVVWRADADKFYYRDDSTGKLRSCSCSIDGGVVIIRDNSDDVVLQRHLSL